MTAIRPVFIPMMHLSAMTARAPILLMRFLRCESGATAIEYGLIAAIVALGIISSLRTVGTNLSSTFTRIGTALTR